MSQQMSSLHTHRNTSSSLLLAVPVYLFLCGLLILCYALNFSVVGYVGMLTTLAIIYHLLDRLLARRSSAFARLGPALDRCVLVIACLVPFISNPSMLLLLLTGEHPPSAAFPRPLPHLPLLGWDTLIELAAITICIALTVSSSFISWQVSKRRIIPSASGRPWLLFVSGLQLFWGNGLLMLSLYPVVALPLWSFMTLTLVLLASALEIRRFGSRWAQPFEALALCAMTFTLLLCTYHPQLIWMVLLLFAVTAYIFIVYQRISSGSFIPFTLALLSIPPLLIAGHLNVVGLLCFLVPVLGVCLRLLLFNRWTKRSGVSEPIWEWSLLSFGLACTVIISIVDAFTAIIYGYGGAIAPTSLSLLTRLPIPFALELAIFAVFWYVVSILVRAKYLITAATVCAVCAFLALPSLPGGLQVSMFVTLVATFLAPFVATRTTHSWSLPFYGLSMSGVLLLQLISVAPDMFLIASLIQIIAVVVWLIEGYVRGERFFISLALVTIVFIVWRGLSYPPLLLVALFLALIAVFIHIIGRRRLQII